MPPVYIYILRDPRTQDVRYVGSTVNPEDRKEEHCLRPQAAAMKCWVGELSAADLQPLFEIIEETSAEDRGVREHYWIVWYENRANLLNTTHTQSAHVFRGRPRGLEKKAVSYRITPVGMEFLTALAQRYGLNNSDMLEVMIREKGRQEGLWHPAERTDREE